MVRGGRPRRHGDLHAGTGPELVRVHPGQQPGRAPRGQDRRCLVRVERPALAEHVDPAGVRRAGAQHGAADQVQVPGPVAVVLGRHHVRPQEGDLRRDLCRQCDRACLVGHREPVTGLALQRGRPLGEHLPGEPGQVRAQHLVRGGPGGRDRAADPAGLVGRPGHPRRELRAAFPGEDQVRMGVDEAGQHRPAAAVDGVVRGRRLPGRTGPGHPARVDDEGRLGQGGERSWSLGRVIARCHVGDQLADVGDQRAHASSRYRAGLPGCGPRAPCPATRAAQIPTRPRAG